MRSDDRSQGDFEAELGELSCCAASIGIYESCVAPRRPRWCGTLATTSFTSPKLTESVTKLALDSALRA
jgi:hypothetical protein